MRKLGKVLVIGAFVNLFSCFVIDMAVGGDALNGRIQNGDYLISNHGRLTKVSPAFWHYSRAHHLSLFITHPLGLLSLFILGVTSQSTAGASRHENMRRPPAPPK